MTTELRIYTMNPGKLDEFVEIWKTRIMPANGLYGIRVHAGWTNREKNEWIWIRSYDDPAVLDVYAKSPEREAYSPFSAPCIASAEVRIIDPVVGNLPVVN